jgi:hypothetical protein
MGLWIFYSVAAVISFAVTAIVGTLIWTSRVAPDQAFENWSKWLKRVGIDDPQAWLKEKGADRKFQFKLFVTVALAIFVFGLVSGIALEDVLRLAGTPTHESHIGNRWEPLSSGESTGLRTELRKMTAEKLNVLCAIPACADLAESLYAAVHDAGWSGNYEGGYMTDAGIKPGMEIWSYPAKSEARNNIIGAIERATNGRLRIAPHQWDGTPMPEQANDINLVVGRLK